MLQGRLGPAYNLRDFLGDSRLTGPVEGQVQTLEHSPGVVAGRLHGRHAGILLGAIGLHQCAEQGTSRSMTAFTEGTYTTSRL